MRSSRADRGTIAKALIGQWVIGLILVHITGTGERQLVEELEGGELMDERVAMEPDPKLVQDIRRLQDKIGDAIDLYYKLRDKHGELGGWEMVENKLTLAIGWAETPLESIPEEDWLPMHGE